MTRTLNISLNVPDSYGIEELTRQLTEYGERLISRRNRVQKSKKRRSQTFLKGLSMPAGTADKELIDEYLSEKNTVNHNKHRRLQECRPVLTPSTFVKKYINVLLH